MHALTNLSPLDGRYYDKVEPLRAIASEWGLMKYRIQVEVQWLITLSDSAEIPQCPALSDQSKKCLIDLYVNFSLASAQAIKDIEATTNHDVKAIEYFIKEAVAKLPEAKNLIEFVHFACTSEDINNLAYALMSQDCRALLLAQGATISNRLGDIGKHTKSMALLSLTHGQPASPTTLGKEILNVRARLDRQLSQFAKQQILGKMNGAVGNFNAHMVAFPSVDWPQLSKQFIESFGLNYNPMTTQIEPHDGLAEMLDNIARINTILIDFSRDMWGYISRGIFTQKLKSGEVGSSTMPHKVNPIDFENAEGNLGVANALIGHLARKLPCSRYQRDLTDSTVLRNLGSSFGYCLLALSALEKGLRKCEPNHAKMQQELDNTWEVLAEPIQTVMRQCGMANPYEKLKDLTRGQKINQASIQAFVETLSLPPEAKERLIKLRPDNYIGLAKELGEELNAKGLIL